MLPSALMVSKHICTLYLEDVRALSRYQGLGARGNQGWACFSPFFTAGRGAMESYSAGVEGFVFFFALRFLMLLGFQGEKS